MSKSNYPYVGSTLDWKSAVNKPEEGKYLVLLDSYTYNGLRADIARYTKCLHDVDPIDFEDESYYRPGWYKYFEEYGFLEVDGVMYYLDEKLP